MAIVTRVNGDAKGVVNVDFDSMVATGLTKRPTAYKITAPSMAAESGVGGAVEAIIRVLTQRATIVMYQVDTTTLSVLVEATGWTNDAELEDAIQAMGATVGTGPIDLTSATVDSSAGFKLA